jgi:hypothetical protein
MYTHTCTQNVQLNIYLVEAEARQADAMALLDGIVRVRLAPSFLNIAPSLVEEIVAPSYSSATAQNSTRRIYEDLAVVQLFFLLGLENGTNHTYEVEQLRAELQRKNIPTQKVWYMNAFRCICVLGFCVREFVCFFAFVCVCIGVCVRVRVACENLSSHARMPKNSEGKGWMYYSRFPEHKNACMHPQEWIRTLPRTHKHICT